MSTLDELADRAAIADVVSGLAHAQDDRNWVALRRLLADEVLLDLSTHHFGRPPASISALSASTSAEIVSTIVLKAGAFA